jgi:Holliday junction resolvase
MNKKLGTEFEREFVKLLNSDGFWVHFIEPKRDGSQPFDIIAVKDGVAFAIDCKTCVKKTFNIDRLESNQVLAFNKWLRCGNSMPLIAVKHQGQIYMIPYLLLKKEKSLRINECEVFDNWKLR